MFQVTNLQLYRQEFLRSSVPSPRPPPNIPISLNLHTLLRTRNGRSQTLSSTTYSFTSDGEVDTYLSTQSLMATGSTLYNTSYEGPISANQKGWKLVVFYRKSGGSHSILCFYLKGIEEKSNIEYSESCFCFSEVFVVNTIIFYYALLL